MALSINRRFWQGKRVLLTGHTGFKGAWACLLLDILGARVFGLALPDDAPSLFADAGVRHLLAGEHLGDIADRQAVGRFVAAARPEVVMHFAAQALVRDCYRRPREAFQTNVMGTVNLLDAVREVGGASVVLTATTDKVYYNAEQGRPFREGDRLGGLEPYSASKAGAELVVAAYRASYLSTMGIAAPVCRAGNVIGGGDWSAERLIPDIVRAVRSGATLAVRNPASVRPWQSVLDALTGYAALIEHAAAEKKSPSTAREADPEASAYNFGPAADEKTIDVGSICGMVERFWPDRFKWEATPDAERIAESKHLTLDAGRASKVLGWRPQYSPEAAVLHTLEWYAAHLDGGDARQLCRRQLEDHLDRVV